LERRREIRIPDPQTKEAISVLLGTPLLPFGPIRRIDWKRHAIASDIKQYNLHYIPHVYSLG
jgi:hypothetical protein